MSELEKNVAPSYQEKGQAQKHNEYSVLAGLKFQRGSVIHTKILTELENRAQKRNDIIPFPEVNRILTWLFHANKQEREQVEKELGELGMIEVIPYHGWRICKNQGKNNVA